MLLSLVAGSAACSRRAPPPLTRTLAGRSVRGAFVPPSSYEAYVRGELLLAQGRAAEAVAQLELATAAPEEDAYLLSRLALAQARAGDEDGAARTLRHAARLDSCSEAVWLTRGELAEARADDVEARAAYARASACAPGSSQGALALSAWLARRGELARSIDVLLDEGHGSQVVQRSLQSADPATLQHALSGLGARGRLSDASLSRAIALALARQQPRLALRLREQHAPRLPPALEAELLQANGRREQLAAHLSLHRADELGGHARTAQLALYAGSYERAELEATSALADTATDALHALRARAAIALGKPRAAMADAREIEDTGLRRGVLSEALAAVGAPALARELP